MNIRLTIQGQSVVVELQPMTEKPKEDGIHSMSKTMTLVDRRRNARMCWYDYSWDQWKSESGFMPRSFHDDYLGWFEIDTITLEEQP